MFKLWDIALMMALIAATNAAGFIFARSIYRKVMEDKENGNRKQDRN